LRRRELLSYPISQSSRIRTTTPRRSFISEPILKYKIVIIKEFSISHYCTRRYWVPPSTPRTLVAVVTVATTTISSAAVGTWLAWAICHSSGALKRRIIVLLDYFYYFKTVWISIRGEGVRWCTAEKIRRQKPSN